jgi:hypothetical protein
MGGRLTAAHDCGLTGPGADGEGKEEYRRGGADQATMVDKRGSTLRFRNVSSMWEITRQAANRELQPLRFRPALTNSPEGQRGLHQVELEDSKHSETFRMFHHVLFMLVLS